MGQLGYPQHKNIGQGPTDNRQQQREIMSSSYTELFSKSLGPRVVVSSAPLSEQKVKILAFGDKNMSKEDGDVKGEGWSITEVRKNTGQGLSAESGSC